MNETHHQNSILNQYASNNGISFYRQVMGDGKPVIHYGIYRNPSDNMSTATTAATETLLNYAHERLQHPPLRILELGSGLGGAAHFLAKKTGANVQCVELSARFNQINIASAEQAGISDNITTWTGSYEELPQEWSDTFDLVWSQEAFCHAYERERVFKEAYRCLKYNGVMAFTDIMLSDKVSNEQAKIYSSVNAISKWSNIIDTLEDIKKCGFQQPLTHDWSDYLPKNFQEMLGQIHLHKKNLIDAGVTLDYIEEFEKSLKKRLEWAPGEVLCWHAVVTVK